MQKVTFELFPLPPLSFLSTPSSALLSRSLQIWTAAHCPLPCKNVLTLRLHSVCHDSLLWPGSACFFSSLSYCLLWSASRSSWVIYNSLSLFHSTAPEQTSFWTVSSLLIPSHLSPVTSFASRWNLFHSSLHAKLVADIFWKFWSSFATSSICVWLYYTTFIIWCITVPPLSYDISLYHLIVISLCICLY